MTANAWNDFNDADSQQSGFDLIPKRGGGAHEIYLEAASAVTTFILAGR